MIYRVDLHVHTNASQAATSSLEELVRAARRAGIDAIAITDHNLCTPVPIELRGVLLIPGCEVNTLGGQILGVFLDRPLDFSHLYRHGLPTADEAVLEIHRCGGLSILAQPFAGTDVNPAQFPIRPDAVETVSARVAAQNPGANKRALLWASEHNRPRVGGSNAYSALEVGNAYTELACPRLSRQFLKEALDLGHCRPVLVQATSQVCCGYSDLALAKRIGNAKQIAKCVAMLGVCRLMDLKRPKGKKKQPPAKHRSKEDSAPKRFHKK